LIVTALHPIGILADDSSSSSLFLALGGGAAIAALSAALVVADPQRRRSAQMQVRLIGKLNHTEYVCFDPAMVANYSMM
jgi:hypothetical protein